jgi:hypothetical protein
MTASIPENKFREDNNKYIQSNNEGGNNNFKTNITHWIFMIRYLPET